MLERAQLILLILLCLPQLVFAGDQAACPYPARSGFAIPSLTQIWQMAAYGMTERKTVAGCPAPWKCGSIPFQTSVVSGGNIHEVSAQIRAGYLSENPRVPFKGNIVYYEGLGDSMLNHLPLFRKLTQAGYRVVAFDYMGQGGSTGNMNDTRITDIPRIGQLAFSKYGRDLQKFPKPTIIGWSTGGLAGYYAAHKNQAERVVLIAPGIVPNLKVGRQHVWPPNFDEITLDTLTTRRYARGEPNPHIDPIRPPSPLAVPEFATDLTETSIIARNFLNVPGNVPGFVLLSGNSDTYVNANETKKALAKRAPQFRTKQYAGALHEIDNEVPSISDRADADILQFIQGEKR